MGFVLLRRSFQFVFTYLKDRQVYIIGLLSFYCVGNGPTVSNHSVIITNFFYLDGNYSRKKSLTHYNAFGHRSQFVSGTTVLEPTELVY